MIHANKGAVTLRGDLTVISAEFIGVIKGFREVVSREVGDEVADFIVADMGRAAFGEGLPDREEIERRAKEVRERSGDEQR